MPSAPESDRGRHRCCRARIKLIERQTGLVLSEYANNLFAVIHRAVETRKSKSNFELYSCRRTRPSCGRRARRYSGRYDLDAADQRPKRVIGQGHMFAQMPSMVTDGTLCSRLDVKSLAPWCRRLDDAVAKLTIGGSFRSLVFLLVLSFRLDLIRVPCPTRASR